MGRSDEPRLAAGFTVIELLIITVIITLIAAMLIPLFLDAVHKAKQKKTMAEMNLVGTATMAWLTDQAAAAAAGQAVRVDDFGSIIPTVDLEDLLVPRYTNAIPVFDGWRNPLEYRMAESRGATRQFLVRSPGIDGSYQSDEYTAGAFDPTDYAQDIVWADGFFVRWPDRAER